MSNIQKIARQAFITFKSRDSSTFPANFEKLKTLVNSIKALDINLEQPDKELNKKSKHFSAPVSYINIFESRYFTLGVFILQNGVSIPLHDHPEMHGICKVLYGSVKVRSFDALSSQNDNGNASLMLKGQNRRRQVKCRYNGDSVFDAESGPCLLSPDVGNYHSIHSINGQAAFLDILAPPYITGERDCSYYREYNSKTEPFSTENDSTHLLVEIPQPAEFYCDSLPYEGPTVQLEE